MSDHRKINLDTPLSNEPGGILANLWRKVVKGNNLERYLLPKVDQYIKETNSLSAKNIKRLAKSSLLTNIGATKLTWSSLHTLIFDYLKAVRMDVTIRIVFANGMDSIHSVTIYPNEKSAKDDIHKEDEKDDK